MAMTARTLTASGMRRDRLNMEALKFLMQGNAGNKDDELAPTTLRSTNRPCGRTIAGCLRRLTIDARARAIQLKVATKIARAIGRDRRCRWGGGHQIKRI